MRRALNGELVKCAKCRVSKKGKDFYWKSKAGDYRKKLPSYCKACEREYTWARNPNRREKLPEGQKRCNSCEIVRSHGEFFFSFNKRTQKSHASQPCKICKSNRLKRENDLARGFSLDVKEGFKICYDCEEVMPIEAFETKTGRIHSYCKPCDRIRSSKWRNDNPEKTRKMLAKRGVDSREAVKNLDDSYIKHLLRRRGRLSDLGEIPQGLIELKRQQMILDRELRNESN